MELPAPSAKAADLAVEPPAKAGIGQYEALVTAASSATQTVMSCGPTKALVKVGGPFSDGFHVEAYQRHKVGLIQLLFTPRGLIWCLFLQPSFWVA